MKPVYRLLTQLSSRKTVSKMSGRLAKSKWSKKWIPHFAKVYKINIDEAEKEMDEYPTLNSFFTRRIKQEYRPIDLRPHRVISPVDGRVTGLGQLKEGTIPNVKGQTYTLADMLGDPKQEKKYANGYYLVLYLSPTDYHRIHSPISGTLVDYVHHMGTVYPVNDFGLVNMKRVLSRNERLISYIQNDQMQTALVKVGAMNVASIRWSDQLTSNEIQKGQELAYFEFGSTVVLLFEKGIFSFDSHMQEGKKVRVGQGIGEIKIKEVEK